MSDSQTSLNVSASLFRSTLTNCQTLSVSDILAPDVHLSHSVAYLVDEVDHGTTAAGQEAKHHPFVLVSCREMALDENDNGQRKSRASEVELGIMMIENQPDELH